MADANALIPTANNTAAVTSGAFDAVDYTRAAALVNAAYDSAEASRLLFFQGEHYQNGKGWVGPFPRNGDASTILLYDSELKREFTAENVAGEIVWRHVMAVTHREPVWGAAPNQITAEPPADATDEGKAAFEKAKDALDKSIERHDTLLRDWFDDPRSGVYCDRKGRLKACSVQRLLQRAALRMVSSERAVLRIFVPISARDASGNLPNLPLAESIKRIHVELCENKRSAVHLDRDSMSEIGVVLWSEKNNQGTTVNMAEVSYVDAQGKSVLKVLSDTAGTDGGEPSILDIGSALLHLEMGGDSLLSDSLLSQQKDINRRLTMSGRVSNMAGFPERTLMNAQLNGRMVADSNAPGGQRFEAEMPVVGPDSINVFNGILAEDGQGNKKYVPASYEIHEPSGSAIYDEAVEAARARMLHESHQTHALISGDATASGISREQARHEFICSLGGTVAELNRAGRWLLPTVLNLAIATSSEKEYRPYADLHFTFECRIDAGPIDSALRAEDRSAVKDGQLSLQTALARAGVDDTDAETDRIHSEQETNLNTVKLKAEILQTLTTVPVAADVAAGIAGFDAAQATAIAESNTVILDGDGFKPTKEDNAQPA